MGDIMEIIKYLIISVVCLAVLIILFFALKSRKFFKIIFVNALFGIGAIGLINLTAKFSGVNIAVNYWTVGAGGVLGLPGVFGILISNFIFL